VKNIDEKTLWYVGHALVNACHQIEDEYCCHGGDHGANNDSCYAQEQYQTIEMLKKAGLWVEEKPE
jgi:hypothetical protein